MKPLQGDQQLRSVSLSCSVALQALKPKSLSTKNKGLDASTDRGLTERGGSDMCRPTVSATLKMNRSPRTRRVILDLSRVKTMDCAGLHGLLICMQEVARYDCAIQLQAVSLEAATLLELARMDHLFRKFPSLPTQAPGFTIASASVAEGVEPREGRAAPIGRHCPAYESTETLNQHDVALMRIDTRVHDSVAVRRNLDSRIG